MSSMVAGWVAVTVGLLLTLEVFLLKEIKLPDRTNVNARNRMFKATDATTAAPRILKTSMGGGTESVGKLDILLISSELSCMLVAEALLLIVL